MSEQITSMDIFRPLTKASARRVGQVARKAAPKVRRTLQGLGCSEVQVTPLPLSDLGLTLTRPDALAEHAPLLDEKALAEILAHVKTGKLRVPVSAAILGEQVGGGIGLGFVPQDTATRQLGLQCTELSRALADAAGQPPRRLTAVPSGLPILAISGHEEQLEALVRQGRRELLQPAVAAAIGTRLGYIEFDPWTVIGGSSEPLPDVMQPAVV